MTITWIASTGTADLTAPNRGTSQPLAYVGVPTGGEVRIAIITAVATDSDNVTPGAWRDLTAAGFTLVRDEEGGLPAHTVGTLFYPHRLATWYKVLTGAESGTITVGNAVGGTFNSSVCVMDVFQTDQPGWALPVAYFGAMVAGPHANNRSVALDQNAVLAAGDWAFMAFAGDRAGTAAVSAVAISQTGATFDTAVLRSTLRNNIGDDSSVITATAPVLTGSTNTPTIGYTMAFPGDGPNFVVRLREDSTPVLTINLAGNAIASGEAFGSATVSTLLPAIAPAGIQGVVLFGEMIFDVALGFAVPSIQAGEQFGEPVVLLGDSPLIELEGYGIPTQEAFGTPSVTADIVFTGPPCDWPIYVCDARWFDFDPSLRQRAERWAVETLYNLSGRQYGACPITVRPCDSCGYRSYEEWTALMQGGFGESWVPFNFNGSWFNCACPGMCACVPFSQVWLPGPVASVQSVKVDGVTVSPAAYRVDDRTWLVRQDGSAWPRTQDLNVPAGDPGTFTVTYTRGNGVPVGGQIAAGALAFEYAQGCVGAACRLPGNVQSISRQGVDIQLLPDTDDGQLTGVPEADQWIRSVNPSRLRRRPRVVSADLHVPRRTTWGA